MKNFPRSWLLATPLIGVAFIGCGGGGNSNVPPPSQEEAIMPADMGTFNEAGDPKAEPSGGAATPGTTNG